MTDAERAEYDKINLTYTKARDEADNTFDAEELNELHQDNSVESDPIALQAWM